MLSDVTSVGLRKKSLCPIYYPSIFYKMADVIHVAIATCISSDGIHLGAMLLDGYLTCRGYAPGPQNRRFR